MAKLGSKWYFLQKKLSHCKQIFITDTFKLKLGLRKNAQTINFEAWTDFGKLILWAFWYVVSVTQLVVTLCLWNIFKKVSLNKEIECLCHFSILTTFLRTIEKSIFIGLLVPVYFVKYGINIWSNAPIRSWFWCHKWQVHFLGNFSVSIDLHQKKDVDRLVLKSMSVSFWTNLWNIGNRRSATKWPRKVIIRYIT